MGGEGGEGRGGCNIVVHGVRAFSKQRVNYVSICHLKDKDILQGSRVMMA
jgi:hypothetical protein